MSLVPRLRQGCASGGRDTANPLGDRLSPRYDLSKPWFRLRRSVSTAFPIPSVLSPAPAPVSFRDDCVARRLLPRQCNFLVRRGKPSAIQMTRGYGCSSRCATVDAPRRRSLRRSHPDSSEEVAKASGISAPLNLSACFPAEEARVRAACETGGPEGKVKSPARSAPRVPSTRGPGFSSSSSLATPSSRRSWACSHAALGDAPRLVTTRLRRSHHGPNHRTQSYAFYDLFACSVPVAESSGR